MARSVIGAMAATSHLNVFAYLSKSDTATTVELKLKGRSRGMRMRASGRDRGNNRKPLQRGRNLSTEAIQTVQALKRGYHNNTTNSVSLDDVFRSKFSRLLKFDMLAVLRELIRQNYCLLALKVFEDVRKEDWYKPKVSLYVDMITVMASNGLSEQVELLYTYLKTESNLEPDTEGFNALLRTLLSFKFTILVMKCYDLMKLVECEPDRTTYMILIKGLESLGESGPSALVRQDAQKCYGESLEFLEGGEMIVNPN